MEMKNIMPNVHPSIKVISFRMESREKFDPLEDLIGIVKLKGFNVEKTLKEKGFEDAGKHLGI